MQRRHFANKGPSSQAMVFPVVVYECESWTMKKAEHQIIDAFKLWCWRRFLRVPWTSRRSTLNIHWKNWCGSWSSNTLATWYKEPIHWERPWCWERLQAGREAVTEDEMVGWYHQLYGHEFETGKPGMLQFMGLWRAGQSFRTEQ